MASNIKKVFKKDNNILIGMIHLGPMLSMKGFTSIDDLVKKALADLKALEAAGFDAVLVENDNDKPHTEFANPAQIACLTKVTAEIVKAAKIPVGVQMMLNDWESSFAIAKASGAVFTRLDVFVDNVTCKWCDINPNPKKIISYKNKIYPELVLLTDIQVKYKKMVKPRPLTTSAALAIKNGSDALVITGDATGKETPIDFIKQVKNKFPNFPVLVGAGINELNIVSQLSIANGAIVGSSLKTNNAVDVKKAKVIVEKLQKR